MHDKTDKHVRINEVTKLKRTKSSPIQSYVLYKSKVNKITWLFIDNLPSTIKHCKAFYLWHVSKGFRCGARPEEDRTHIK